MRRHRLRRRDAAPPDATAQWRRARSCQAILDVEPRRRRQRLRPRVPFGRRRQARRSSSCSPTWSTKPRRVHSLAAVPVLARRHAVVVASVTRSRPATHAMMRDARRRTRDVYADGVARRRARRAHGASRPGSAAPGRRVSERAGRAVGRGVRRCVPTPQGAGPPLVAVRAVRARARTRRPRTRHRARRRRRAPSPGPGPRGDEAFDEAGDHEPRLRSRAIISTAARDSSRSATPRGRVPGIDDRPAHAQSRGARRRRCN